MPSSKVAISVILEVRAVTAIDEGRKTLVRLNLHDQKTKNTVGEHVKLRGTTSNGMDVYLDLELIGSKAQIDAFRFVRGQHAGIVIRLID